MNGRVGLCLEQGLPHLDFSNHPFLIKVFDPKAEPVPPLTTSSIFVYFFLLKFVLKNFLF